MISEGNYMYSNALDCGVITWCPCASSFHPPRLVFTRTQHHVTAEVFSSSSPVPVLSCSTKEWALKRELTSTTCVAACQAVGDVLAHRCVQAGINRMVYREIPWAYRSKAVSPGSTSAGWVSPSSWQAACFSLFQIQSFRSAMKEGGIILSEPRRKFVGTWFLFFLNLVSFVNMFWSPALQQRMILESK